MKTLFAVLAVLALTGCATDPATGKTHWDAGATWRVVGAAVDALQQRSPSTETPAYEHREP